MNVRLKDVVSTNARTLPETTDPDFTFRYVDISAVSQGRIDVPADEVRFEAAPSRARRLAEPGDTVVSTVRTYLRGIARVPEALDPLVFSTGFAVLHPKRDRIDDRFLSYYCTSTGFVESVVARSVGVSYPAINASEVADVRLNLPPLDEQRRIADFLDTETARLDGLTKMRSDELGLLAQRRRAVVRDLVIGANHQDRNPSTLPWCDSIPQGWDVVPLKYVAAYGSGHTPSRTHPEYWVDCDIPWISLFDVGKMRDPRQLYLSETEQQISQLGVANSSATLHPKGTVVLSRTASVGFATIMRTDMAVSQHFATWTCGPRLLPEYLLHLLRTMTPLFDSLKVGTTNVTVFMPDLLAMRVPLPSLAEQRDIAARIGEQSAEIDEFADALERQVELLRERRQALITAAVTGQFDITTASRSQRPVHSP